jgi:hypothetical protein
MTFSFRVCAWSRGVCGLGVAAAGGEGHACPRQGDSGEEAAAELDELEAVAMGVE